MVQWPENERRREYVELLITLNAEMKEVKQQLKNIFTHINFQIEHCPMCRNDFKWMWWAIRGIFVWISGLTWWIIEKMH